MDDLVEKAARQLLCVMGEMKITDAQWQAACPKDRAAARKWAKSILPIVLEGVQKTHAIVPKEPTEIVEGVVCRLFENGALENYDKNIIEPDEREACLDNARRLVAATLKAMIEASPVTPLP
jgi:hypothetical protein